MFFAACVFVVWDCSNYELKGKQYKQKPHRKVTKLKWKLWALNSLALDSGTHGVSRLKAKEKRNLVALSPLSHPTLSRFKFNARKKLLIFVFLSFINRGGQANYRVPRHATVWAIRQSEHGEEFPCPVISGGVPGRTRRPGSSPAGIRSRRHHEHHCAQW